MASEFVVFNVSIHSQGLCIVIHDKPMRESSNGERIASLRVRIVYGYGSHQLGSTALGVAKDALAMQAPLIVSCRRKNERPLPVLSSLGV
jgi:hypothetical protein